MAGFLKTEENRRLAVSAGSAAVVYILLFLFFAVYFAVGRREPQSFGASAVYLNLTQVSQAAVREEGANPSSGSSAKQSASTQSASTQSASTQSASTQSASTQSAAASPERPVQTVPEKARSHPAAAESTQAAVTEERFDDFFADTAFGASESVSADSGTSADFSDAAAASEESFFDSGDYSRLDSALAQNATGSDAAGDTLSTQTTSAAGLSGGDSVSVVDLDGLTAGRKLLHTVDPDFSGVDTAGRSGFSFVIAFDLNADGTLSRIVVTDSSGSTTADRRMEQALRQWRFAAVDGGEAVHVRLKYYVRVR